MQFQIRRAGVIDPGLYTLGQLQGFTGSGHLLPTDEVSVAGANVWQPMQQAIASAHGQGGQVETSPPHVATPQFPQPWGAEVPKAATGSDWMMPAKTLRWIVRGCLMATLLAALLPWDDYDYAGGAYWYGGNVVSGWEYSDGVGDKNLVVGWFLFLTVVTIVLSWVPGVRAWGFVGSTASLLLLMYWVFEYARGLASGSSLAIFLLLAASIFGLFAFIQHKKWRPAW